MKPRFISSTPVAIFVALAFALGIAHAQTPRFFGVLPLPPQQNLVWPAPESGVPTELATASKLLFDNGLADPRGCEYRDIAVVVGDVRGDANVMRTHGWLLPGDGTENHFAVCWNGLVYPAASVGAGANLQDDLRASRGATREGWQHLAWPSFAPSEAWSLSSEPIRPLGACLLLRLGENAAAKEIWDAYRHQDAQSDALWFLSASYLWARFDRALCAHLRSDDRLALLDLRAVQNAAAKLEVLVRQRGDGTELFGGKSKGIFDFLAPLPRLLADQERRAKGFVPFKKSKVASLIAALENVRAEPQEPSWAVNLADDPVVQELVAQGESAVSPLLDVMEHDERLTRSVRFYRPSEFDRHLFTVPEAAYVAVSRILGNYSLGSGDVLAGRPNQRAALVARVRAFWAQKQAPGSAPANSTTNAERWFSTLANDKSDIAEWLKAAQNIMRPSDAVWRGSAWVVDPRLRGAKWTLSGEALRKRKNPSLSQLIARRVAETCRRALNAKVEEGFLPLRQSGELALLLTQWDAKAAPPTLRLYFQNAAQTLSNPPKTLLARLAVLEQLGNFERRDEVIRRNNDCAQLMPRFLRARLQFGDTTALDDYAKWLRQPTGGVPFQYATGEIFAPLWRHRAHPAMTRLAWDLFEGKDSPFSPFLPLHPRSTSDLTRDESIGSGLLTLSPFRRMLLRELQNTEVMGAVVGTMDTLRSGRFQIELKDAPVANRSVQPNPMVHRIAFRRCDYYAMALSRVEGAPLCQLFWPPAQRDNAVAWARDYLERFGGRLQTVIGDDFYTGDSVHLVVPHLNRIASSDDIARGAAIFTLAEPGQKRPVAMPFPLRARKKLDKAPGWVWQAEELLQNGVWRRFYGFVGPHEIVKMRAEELELLP